jgi:hypothetical protein
LFFFFASAAFTLANANVSNCFSDNFLSGFVLISSTSSSGSIACATSSISCAPSGSFSSTSTTLDFSALIYNIIRK